jgi:hypothetical protein
VIYIIHRVEEVTEFVQLKQRGEQQAQNEALRRRAEQKAEWQAALISEQRHAVSDPRRGASLFRRVG